MQDPVEMIHEHGRQLVERRQALPPQLSDPELQVADHRAFAAIRPQPLETLLEQVGLEEATTEGEDRIQPVAGASPH